VQWEDADISEGHVSRRRSETTEDATARRGGADDQREDATPRGGGADEEGSRRRPTEDATVSQRHLARRRSEAPRSAHTLRITAREIDPARLDQAIVGRLRASVLFMGALLARAGSTRIAYPGGDLIGARPLSTHFAALEALGATIEARDDHYAITALRLRGVPLVLREFSVTATENALMAAALAQGKTTIHIAAAEPQVGALARFLNRMGARITGIGTHELTVQGVRRLGGAQARIMGDYIEAGTYAAAFAATRGKGIIGGVDPAMMELPILKLREAGVPVTVVRNELHIAPALTLKALPYPGIQTLPYPGFPTDLQAPFAVLATQLNGVTAIQETLYEGRFKYLDELCRMGAHASVIDAHRALMTGPTPLYGTTIPSLDLRAGATLVIAALVAEGRSVLKDAYNIDRGYERIEEKLAALGADIKRVSNDE
ncbi:MAG: UDP-N-acetylglucosamine 1-carboxyvinyltransferase, partial [Patescibacteria group bacterium]|nr:UDP-N-acetylglucosamine 1-carboxyvinyltransferase [Patescibacteria group bacterium]